MEKGREREINRDRRIERERVRERHKEWEGERKYDIREGWLGEKEGEMGSDGGLTSMKGIFAFL